MQSDKFFSVADFSALMAVHFPDVSKVKKIVVGLSGGPDSMALARLLSAWSVNVEGPEIYTFTVDHGLRKESAREAKETAERVKGWPKITHKILKWKGGGKSKTRIQETARAARYELLASAMKREKIRHLFLAHHLDDQAETFLFRLAKGSGVDGLAGMMSRQERDGIILCRPLLSVPKVALVELCRKHKISYAQDPSNNSERFARPRLRKAMNVLEDEGLSAKRLGQTAARIARARAALEEIAEKIYAEILIEKRKTRIVLDYKKMMVWPEEIGLRVLLLAMADLEAGGDYGPRLERVEALFADLRGEGIFRKRTLGGLVFERKRGQVVLTMEAWMTARKKSL